MLRVKRTKTAAAPDGKLVGVAKVHYATAVSARGAIDSWSEDADLALPITEAAADRVKAYYAKRHNVGSLTFESVKATAAAAAKAEAADAVTAVDAIKALQHECKRLSEDNARLKAAKGDAEVKADKATGEVAGLRSRITDLELADKERSDAAGKTLDEAAAQITGRDRRIAELEKELAEAKAKKK